MDAGPRAGEARGHAEREADSTDHPALWACARRLAAHPAFGTHQDLDGIERRHHARSHGLEAAGAAVRIPDRAAHAAR